ncbi:uncharacterized protein BP5553_08784 [Venustampulla echinocandica]|uniref:Clr5 domain-containing protein n=1 Tax=Venustampulla echinocandica TaxID=2656787 RepID=A0A370TF79_9HELO|nr:uncharacterized protein BP5553_08784 [Venustampulla echinocandica]RDL33345.1 hypothetical protein BP5553_08784 [Venustampulla echinocandica]
MDVRNVELSIEDILFIHRHWITKLYLDDQKSEDEIVDMLYERRLPVTISQIQNCLMEWDLISFPSTRRGSSASASSAQSSSEGWEALRSASPTSSTTSHHSTAPENVALYSKRPLPSLPSSASSSRSTSASRPCPSGSKSQNLPARLRRFADRSSHDLLQVTCHHSGRRNYEVEMTLGVIPYEGPSLLDLYTRDMEQSHERIAVGLKRVTVPTGRGDSYCDKASSDEFEWMRQWKRHSGGRSRRVVEILQMRDADDADIEDEYEGELRRRSRVY